MELDTLWIGQKLVNDSRCIMGCNDPPVPPIGMAAGREASHEQRIIDNNANKGLK
jgi:hypothetical protein